MTKKILLCYVKKFKITCHYSIENERTFKIRLGTYMNDVK